MDAVRGESLIVFYTSFCTLLFSTTCTAREGREEWHAPAPTGAERMSLWNPVGCQTVTKATGHLIMSAPSPTRKNTYSIYVSIAFLCGPTQKQKAVWAARLYDILYRNKYIWPNYAEVMET